MTRWCSIACVLEKGGTENERRSALMVYVSINHLGHFTGPGSAHSLQTRLKSTGAHSYKGICTLLSPKESQIWCIWAIKSVSLQNCHFLWYKSLGLSFPGRKIKGCLNLWAPWALPSASSRLAKSSEFLNISVLRCTVTPLHFSTEPVRMSTSLSTLVLSWLKNSSQGWEEEGKKKKKNRDSNPIASEGFILFQNNSKNRLHSVRGYHKMPVQPWKTEKKSQRWLLLLHESEKRDRPSCWGHWQLGACGPSLFGPGWKGVSEEHF